MTSQLDRLWPLILSGSQLSSDYSIGLASELASSCAIRVILDRPDLPLGVASGPKWLQLGRSDLQK